MQLLLERFQILNRGTKMSNKKLDLRHVKEPHMNLASICLFIFFLNVKTQSSILFSDTRNTRGKI